MTPEEERSGDLLDVALADEIELVSDLVVAASSSPRHFTPEEVDALLGISAQRHRHRPRLPERRCRPVRLRASGSGRARGLGTARGERRIDGSVASGVTTTP